MKTQIILICVLIAFASGKWMRKNNFLSQTTSKHLQGWPSPACVQQLDDITSLKFKLQQGEHEELGFSQLIFALYWSNGIQECIAEEAAHMKFYLTSITDGQEKNCAQLNDPVEDGPNADKYIALPSDCDFDLAPSTEDLCGDPKFGNWKSMDTNFKQGVLATHVTTMYFKYDDIMALTDSEFLNIVHAFHENDGTPTPNYDETKVMAQMQLWFNEGGVHKWMNFDFGIRKYLDGRSGDAFEFAATEMKKATCENNDCYVDKHFQVCSTYVEDPSNWNLPKVQPYVFNRLLPIYLKFKICANAEKDYVDYKIVLTKYSMQLESEGQQRTIWTPEEMGNRLQFADPDMYDEVSKEIRISLRQISLRNGKGTFYGDFRAVHQGTGAFVKKSESKSAAYESFGSRMLQDAVDPPVATVSSPPKIQECNPLEPSCAALAPGEPLSGNQNDKLEKESHTALYLAMGAFALGVVAVALIAVSMAGKKFDQDNTYLKEDYNEIE